MECAHRDRVDYSLQHDVYQNHNPGGMVLSGCAALDLRNAVIVVRADALSTEKKAAQMLTQEITRRTQLRVDVRNAALGEVETSPRFVARPYARNAQARHPGSKESSHGSGSFGPTPETLLDMDAVLGTAPGAKIVVYISPWSSGEDHVGDYYTAIAAAIDTDFKNMESLLESASVRRDLRE